MTFLPENIINCLKDTYKPSSIKTYDSSIKRLHKLAGYPTTSFRPGVILRFSEMKNAMISNNVKLTSQITIVSAVNAICNCVDEFVLVKEGYAKLFAELVKKSKRHNKKREATEDEKKHKLEWNEIIAKREEYRKRFIKPKTRTMDVAKAYRILTLMTEVAPLKGSEYIDMRIKKLTKREEQDIGRICHTSGMNVLCIRTSTMYVCDHGTVERYGIKIIPFGPKVLKAVRQTMRVLNPGSITKINSSDMNLVLPVNLKLTTPMTSSVFTNFMYRVFDPFRISTNAIRKAYTVQFLHKNPSHEDRLFVAAVMGNSLDMQKHLLRRDKKERK